MEYQNTLYISGRQPILLRAPGAAGELLRYDGLNHWTDISPQKRAICKVCAGRSKFICKKCKVPLHPMCMEIYHSEQS
jgi:hypothetical protein